MKYSRWIKEIFKMNENNKLEHVQNLPIPEKKRTRPKLAGSCHIMSLSVSVRLCVCVSVTCFLYWSNWSIRVFQECFYSVWVFPECLRVLGVSLVFHQCLKGISIVFQECFECFSRMLQECFKSVLWVFQVCFECAWNFFDDTKNILRMMLKTYLRNFPMLVMTYLKNMWPMI